MNKQTILSLSRADEALGRLAGVGSLLPNDAVLVRPYAMKEALASARIEGTQTDLQSAFREEARPSEVRHQLEVRDVVSYLRALETGLKEVETHGRLDWTAVCTIHKNLMGEESEGSGVRRKDLVWLGSPTDRPETADFVPPIGTALNDLLDDWDLFLAEPPDLPPLIRAALIHYQFLTIHPFIDGNGRAGRLLVLLFLAAERRLPVPLLYLSPYFEGKRREYYDRLQAVREKGELQAWLQFFLTAVEAQANDGVARARALLDLRERYRAELAGSRSRSMEVVELLFQNPLIYAAKVREDLDISNQGALNQLRALEKRGWLHEIGRTGRGGTKLWLAHEVFETIEKPIT